VSQPSSIPQLEWVEPSGQRQQFVLQGNLVVIGRRMDSDIVLSHQLVSRRHAQIVRDENRWLLVDLQSTHGTYVNGTPIERHRLISNDRIQLGRTGIELLFVRQPEDRSRLSSGLLESPGVNPSVQRMVDVLPSASGVHSDLEKIASLLDFHYYFGKEFSAEKTFHQILKSALQISGAERGFVLRRQAVGFCYALGLDGAGQVLLESDFRTSSSVVEQVTSTGEPVFMTQGISDKLAEQESIVAMNLRAIACLPLESFPDESERTITGILYLDSQKYMHSLSGLDQKLLTRLAGEAGNVLEKIQLIESLAEGRRIEQELAVAEETQRTLLPASLPMFSPFQISAFSRATRQLGGDFYDFIPVDGPEVAGPALAGMLGDVSGKGIPAALLASLALGALNMQFSTHNSPADVLSRVNNLLFQKIPPNRFVTLFLFQLETDGKGQYLNAGHNPAYLFRAATGEIEEMPAGGLPLGMFEEAWYEPVPFELYPGDTLVVYSDGLTDAENAAAQNFGEDRLRALIIAKAPHGIEALRDAMLNDLNEFTHGAAQNDDITFLMVENATGCS
jgi:sigma-B regulation protein RsbU (phosphoserine phosphatase)